ncbi:transposase [Micromonospora sonneratiae]|uniref:Transposase n=1 Tax=Micromonospora sonneratiae TaxID=1184706 RepID=A0ABW3YD47_9ACTN
MLDQLREQVRVSQGRNPQPSAGIIDSQSVKAADTVARDSRGYDAGKKINGRKRFIVTDTLRLLLVVMVCAANVQDRDGAKSTLLSLYLATPVRFVLADGGFAGRLVDWATRILATTLHIVRKPAGQRGFTLIPRRWPVERSFAWFTNHHRLARELRTRPRPFGGHDPLGRDQHHDPPPRPWQTGHPPTTPHLQPTLIDPSQTLTQTLHPESGALAQAGEYRTQPEQATVAAGGAATQQHRVRLGKFDQRGAVRKHLDQPGGRLRAAFLTRHSIRARGPGRPHPAVHRE